MIDMVTIDTAMIDIIWSLISYLIFLSFRISSNALRSGTFVGE